MEPFPAPLALYLHLPFCAAKCAYCDFASYAGRLALAPAYLRAMEAELRGQAERVGPRALSSVFIGGGTPTLLPGAAVAALLHAARAAFGPRSDAEADAPEVEIEFKTEIETEITMEGNPGTLRAKDLAACRAAGVNRVSLGAQAAQDRLLAALGRVHRWRDVEAGMALLRAEGFQNLNVDLMFGLPGQSLADWRDTLEAALALRPEHLSCYALQVEPGTPLAARLAAGEGPLLPGEEEERAMYALARATTERAGLVQYELSNFALPGRECRQNWTYWTRGEYLGVGCAAHSLVGDARWGNDPSLEGYLAATARGDSPAVERERLTEADARFETLMLGLRLTRGIPRAAFVARFGATPEAVWGDRLDGLIRRGLIEADADGVRLTPRGMDVQNAVLVALMD